LVEVVHEKRLYRRHRIAWNKVLEVKTMALELKNYLIDLYLGNNGM
jgi:hypothetical protein